MSSFTAEFSPDGFTMMVQQSRKNLCVLHCHSGQYTSAKFDLEGPVHPDGRPILTPMGRASLDIVVARCADKTTPASVTDLCGDGTHLEFSLTLEEWQLPWLIDMHRICQNEGQVLGFGGSRVAKPDDASLDLVVDGGERVVEHNLDLIFLGPRKANLVVDHGSSTAPSDGQGVS